MTCVSIACSLFSLYRCHCPCQCFTLHRHLPYLPHSRWPSHLNCRMYCNRVCVCACYTYLHSFGCHSILNDISLLVAFALLESDLIYILLHARTRISTRHTRYISPLWIPSRSHTYTRAHTQRSIGCITYANYLLLLLLFHQAKQIRSNAYWWARARVCVCVLRTFAIRNRNSQSMFKLCILVCACVLVCCSMVI